jgi:hypothetical protein
MDSQKFTGGVLITVGFIQKAVYQRQYNPLKSGGRYVRKNGAKNFDVFKTRELIQSVNNGV